MAKKSSKSTRRTRAKKQETTKKNPTTKVTKTAAVIAEGSDEPVVKAEKKTPAKKPAAQKATKKETKKPIETAVAAEVEKLETEQSVEDSLIPQRHRALVNAVALGVVVIALIFGAAIIRQQNTDKQAEQQMVQSGQSSGKADQILQSGGKVCTNGNSQTDTTGSSNPQSVGMMLQNNPASTIQTPQTLGSGSDASALQGASCF